MSFDCFFSSWIFGALEEMLVVLVMCLAARARTVSGEDQGRRIA